RLAERKVAETDVAEAGKDAMDRGKIFEESEGLFDGQVEHVGDRQPFVADGKRLAVETPAFTDGTIDEQVGQELHFQSLEALPLTFFAASAGDVKAEATGLEAELLGFFGRSKNLANFVERAGVGRGVAAGGAADGRLVDGNYLVDVGDAAEGRVRAGLWGDSTEAANQGRRERFIDQRAFAGAADARDAD